MHFTSHSMLISLPPHPLHFSLRSSMFKKTPLSQKTLFGINSSCKLHRPRQHSTKHIPTTNVLWKQPRVIFLPENLLLTSDDSALKGKAQTPAAAAAILLSNVTCRKYKTPPHTDCTYNICRTAGHDFFHTLHTNFLVTVLSVKCWRKSETCP